MTGLNLGQKSAFSVGERVRVVLEGELKDWTGVIVPSNYSEHMSACAVLLDADEDELPAFFTDGELELISE